MEPWDSSAIRSYELLRLMLEELTRRGCLSLLGDGNGGHGAVRTLR